jgi:ATP-binding cassette, subfamily A (ABC1), member 3
MEQVPSPIPLPSVLIAVILGKTTTLSILTGLIEPSRGDCLIWNSRLSSELAAIRQLTGICPQHNVLFPALTVKEHLVFFARMKGLYGPDLKSSVDRCIEDVGLVEKRDVLSSALSGGMKRKLCLAMALIGDPKFVLLDEPTSGMDPYSRRSTWELLQKSKAGRVIILTTHFMVCFLLLLSSLIALVG